MKALRSLPLDCEPLSPSVDAPLSHADLRRIEPLQDVLLSPLDYETVDDWRAAANEAAKVAFGGDSAMFQMPVPGVTLHFSARLSARALSDYSGLLPDLNRVAGISRRIRQIGAGNRSILWGEHLEWLYGSPYFNELVVDQCAFDPVWVAAPVADSPLPAVLHTYHDRRYGGRRFGAVDVQLMRALRPAFEAGVRTVVRAAASRASLTTSLDGQREGALVYDLTGSLLHRNPAVHALVATERDERMLIEAGAEMACALSGGELIQVFAPASASRRLATRTGEYQLNAVRVAEGVFALRPVVLVTLPAGPEPLPDRMTLRERFGLTRRQAEVALLLARRKTNVEIAAELVISAHTALRHTEAVMAKLKVHHRRLVAERLREHGDR